MNQIQQQPNIGKKLLIKEKMINFNKRVNVSFFI